MARILKFATKIGIVGGAIYYSRQIGVWEDSETTYELGRKGVSYVIPYLTRLEKEVPKLNELRNLPSSEDVCRTVNTYWNRGVISSVAFLERLPSNVNYYVGEGVSYISAQMQQEKLGLSFSKEDS